MNHQESSREIVSMWLRVATKDLTAPVQERIRLEIEAHFYDAVENHLAEGLAPIDAQLAAFNELGQAITAAKCFRQKHLTSKEVEYVKHVSQFSFALIWFSTAYALLTISPAVTFLSDRVVLIFWLTGLGAAICHEVYRRKAQPNFKLLISMIVLSDVIFLCLSSVITLSLNPWTFNWFLTFGLSLALIYSIFRGFRFLAKLIKTSDLSQEMPPTTTA